MLEQNDLLSKTAALPVWPSKQGSEHTSGCLTMASLRESQLKVAFRLVSMALPMPSITIRSTPSAAATHSGDSCTQQQGHDWEWGMLHTYCKTTATDDCNIKSLCGCSHTLWRQLRTALTLWSSVVTGNLGGEVMCRTGLRDCVREQLQDTTVLSCSCTALHCYPMQFQATGSHVLSPPATT